MSWAAFSRETEIGNGTAQRINEMTSDASLSTLDAISAHYGLQAWHLLLPKLDPRNPPVFLMTEAEQQVYDMLAKSCRAVAEQRPAYTTRR